MQNEVGLGYTGVGIATVRGTISRYVCMYVCMYVWLGGGGGITDGFQIGAPLW